MKKYLIGIALSASVAAPFVHADTVFGVYAGATSWNSDFSGNFNSKKNGNIDVKDQLDLGGETASSFYIAVEHPIPLLPNIKIRKTDVAFSKDTILTKDVKFDDKTFTASTPVKSTFDLNHTDATFYYEILDNWVSLDLGLTARKFGGKAAVESLNQAAKLNLDATIPMVYAMVQFDLPLTGAYVGAETNFIGYSGNSLKDIILKAGYESELGIGAEVGYRTISLKLDDVSDLSTDIKSSGAYASVTYHF